jgi:hypothetical protein
VRSIALALSLAACGGDLQFSSTLPEGPPKPLDVAVLGIYHDGRMAADEWNELGRSLVGALGEPSCGIFYSSALPAAHPDIAAAIDKHARAVGVTDALFEALAPATGADAIVLVELSGHTPRVLRTETTPRLMNLTMAKPASSYQTHVVTDGSAIDVAVSAFSTREHKIVARLAMRYTGNDAKGALRAFGDRFAKEFPSWRCAAWRSELPIDAAAIEKIAD